MQRIVANLLDNLALHTPAGTRAHVSVKTDDDMAHIYLTDDSPGIPAKSGCGFSSLWHGSIEAVRPLGTGWD